MAKSFAPEMMKQLALFKQSTKIFDHSTAAAISHGIKGIASNFGARRLAAHAAYLEKQFKQECPELIDIKRWTDTLEELINQSSQQLSTYFEVEEFNAVISDNVEKAVYSSVSVQSVKTDLNTLMNLLKENNLEAMALTDQLAELLSGHPQWSILNGQVQALDFNQALDTLRIIMLEEA